MAGSPDAGSVDADRQALLSVLTGDSPANLRRAASRRDVASTSDMNTSALAEQERARVPSHARCKRCAGGSQASRVNDVLAAVN